ncbi:hypothetical protein [Yinghuangia soli]|uniref:Uncharacterized protein n=1 Tax=Yinghuangia soli TaxID=2908204 RepID=A0AA41PVP6_9ACTN|nr:hypothetical protein [Yinghuangia soli]MCF2526744.1 hypothetical protein [Yinghuangia soli]
MVQTGTVDGPNHGYTATVAEGYGLVRTPDADHSGSSRSDDVGGTDPIVAEGAQNVRTPDDEIRTADAMSDADLRKAARKLQRDALRTTKGSVTIQTLQTELGLSRRRAAELRRGVVGGRS